VLRSAGTVQESVNSLNATSPFRYIGETGISAAEHHEGSLLEQIDLNTWITMSVQRAVETISSRLSGGLAFLATVGSTAPFVGLFGTVWGIYHALTAIGIAGQASIDKVAGPVGEALIMTAIGLAAAVPAVLGYNFLVRRNKNAMERVRNFASDLHLGDQHHAAGRRDAGAADHLSDHHPGGDPHRAGEAARRPQRAHRDQAGEHQHHRQQGR
jgi:biopolymer transport protein ExbB